MGVPSPGPSIGAGGQAFYSHGAPGPLGTLALGNGNAGTLSGTLGADSSQLGRLVQAVVRVSGNLGTETESESGPVWAELWLNRGNALALMLDKGYVRAGGARGATSVVGMVGSLSVRLGDSLVLRAANDSGATVTLVLEACVNPPDPSVPDDMTTLSTEPYAIWLFTGNVTVDATAGTHVTSFTASVAAGDEMEVLYGAVIVGNTATAQTVEVLIQGPSAVNVSWIMNPLAIANTLASETYIFPQAGQNTAALLGTDIDFLGPVSGIKVFGTMVLVMRTTTTQITLVHTYRLVAKVRGRKPLMVGADTVGAGVPLVVNDVLV